MSTRRRKLTRAEIKAALDDFGVKPILSTAELADVLGYRVSTVYEWIAQGRFDGAFRKRGKHQRFWRDRAIDLFFNGPEWTT